MKRRICSQCWAREYCFLMNKVDRCIKCVCPAWPSFKDNRVRIHAHAHDFLHTRTYTAHDKVSLAKIVDKIISKSIHEVSLGEQAFSEVTAKAHHHSHSHRKTTQSALRGHPFSLPSICGHRGIIHAHISFEGKLCFSHQEVRYVATVTTIDAVATTVLQHALPLHPPSDDSVCHRRRHFAVQKRLSVWGNPRLVGVVVPRGKPRPPEREEVGKQTKVRKKRVCRITKTRFRL